MELDSFPGNTFALMPISISVVSESSHVIPQIITNFFSQEQSHKCRP